MTYNVEPTNQTYANEVSFIMNTRQGDTNQAASNKELFKIVHLASKKREGNDPLIHNVFLFGKTASILEEKCNLLKQYTTKVDPRAMLPEVEIKDNRSHQLTIRATSELIIKHAYHGKNDLENLDIVSASTLSVEGFHYYVNVLTLLPRPVAELYGMHSFNTTLSNCHKTANICAGFFPVILADYELEKHQPESKPISIQLSAIAAGDKVSLQKSHSFVFLDDDLSLSMNGQARSLLLYHTEEILALYHMSSDALRFPPNDAMISILRKPDNWHYPEEIMGAVLEFAEIARFNDSYLFDKDSIGYSRVKEICEVFRDYCDKVHPQRTHAWEDLYKDFCMAMPAYMLKNNETITTHVDTSRLTKWIIEKNNQFHRVSYASMFNADKKITEPQNSIVTTTNRIEKKL